MYKIIIFISLLIFLIIYVTYNSYIDISLHEPSKQGDITTVRQILNTKNYNINEVINQTTPLFVVVEQGHYDIAKLLIQNPADVNDVGIPPICVASSNGDYKMVKLLLDNGAHCNSFETQSMQAIKHAVIGEHYDVVKLLLLNGGVKNEIMRPPLHVAAGIGNFDIVRILVQYGAKIDAGVTSPISHALHNNNLDIAKYLVHQITRRQNAPSLLHEPLCVAAYHGYFDFVKFLLDKGADVNRFNGSVLRFALEGKQFDIAKYLLDVIDTNAIYNFTEPSPRKLEGILICKSFPGGFC